MLTSRVGMMVEELREACAAWLEWCTGPRQLFSVYTSTAPTYYRHRPSDVIEIGHPYFCKIVVMHYATTPKPRTPGGAVIYVEYR